MLDLLEQPTARAPTPKDVDIATKAAAAITKRPKAALKLAINGDTIPLPQAAAELLRCLLHAMARGQAVLLMPLHAELTTQQAAELIGVSRPFLIKEIEAGKIPHHRVGKHRRIRVQDITEYKQSMHESRQETLKRLTDETRRLGLKY